jgi:hypothetical protein
MAWANFSSLIISLPVKVMATNFVNSNYPNQPFNALEVMVGGKQTIPLTDGTLTGKFKIIHAVNDDATITSMDLDEVEATEWAGAVIDKGDFLFLGRKTATSITVSGSVWLTEVG